MTQQEFDAQCAFIRQAIEYLEGRIAAEWDRAEPQMRRYVSLGQYEQEMYLRSEISGRCSLIKDEINALSLRLPPHLILREDGALEMIARAA